jgi:hypothetical protein
VEDRRARDRHPSDVRIAIQAHQGTVRLPARILDVSPKGIGLRVGSALGPGAMVGVEVPGGSAESETVVLACVAHVRPHGEGEWVVGCSFTHDLSDEDFAAFRGEPAIPQPDRRESERFPCPFGASFEPVGSETTRSPARVLNLSLGGVALLADRPVPVGTVLSLELRGEGGPARHSLLACVVHLTTRPGGEWVLGCDFLHDLTEAQLRALL